MKGENIFRNEKEVQLISSLGDFHFNLSISPVCVHLQQSLT